MMLRPELCLFGLVVPLQNKFGASQTPPRIMKLWYKNVDSNFSLYMYSMYIRIDVYTCHSNSVKPVSCYLFSVFPFYEQ